MKNKRQVIPFRRKRSGKTNYKKRIAYLTSGLPRLVIRRSLKSMTAQIVVYEPQGDKVLVAATSQELKKLGWTGAGSNIPASYLVGFLVGKKAIKAKVQKAIVDLGLYQPVKGSKIFGVLKGAVDAGLEVPHEASVVPSADRIQGKHIAAHRKTATEKNFADVLAKMKGI
ncbi:MAG TPA: 50S ribosomal protein L18 [Candidatus Nanoarchaeia archaeon]|nr:50S ribosomal protein L18 [Candidatus Nanoarchaeia archaeon]